MEAGWHVYEVARSVHAYTVYERKFGDIRAKKTVYTPYIYIYMALTRAYIYMALANARCLAL